MSDSTAAEVTNEQGAEVPEPEAVETVEKTGLGDAGKKALDAERTARKEAEKRLSEAAARIAEFEDAQRTEEEKRQHELETLRAQIEDERKQREAVERDLLVKSVAAEYGLPDELAGRLAGEDREALVEDAKVLQKLMAPSGPRKPAPVPEVGTASTPKASKGEIFENAWRGAFG
jgi:hypothetical protein